MIINGSMVLDQETETNDFSVKQPGVNSLIRLFRKTKDGKYRSISISGVGTPTIDSIGKFAGINNNYLIAGTGKHITVVEIVDPQNGYLFSQNIEGLYWTPITDGDRKKVEKRTNAGKNRCTRSLPIDRLLTSRN